MCVTVQLQRLPMVVDQLGRGGQGDPLNAR